MRQIHGSSVRTGGRQVSRRRRKACLTRWSDVFFCLLCCLFTVLRQCLRQGMAQAKTFLRHLLTLAVGHSSQVPLVQEIMLHSHVVVRDRENGGVVLRKVPVPADKIQGALCVLHRLVMLVKLRHDSANVQVRASNRYIIRLKGDLDFERLPQVTKCRVELPNLFVITTQVVACHREETRGLLRLLSDKHRLSVLQLFESLLELPCAQEIHAVLVAIQHEVLAVAMRHTKRFGITSLCGAFAAPAGDSGHERKRKPQKHGKTFMAGDATSKPQT
mmetsp:Transcript_61185/g.162602  ORF Transcript_61185/g.162602 Transcript_61185/m.162602 type:complete len:274 (+) Transcript_61185:2242-3063(+)